MVKAIKILTMLLVIELFAFATLVAISNATRVTEAELVHEMAHAITVSHGLLNSLRAQLPHEHATFAEEWSADLMADHGIEAAMLASRSLGRPLCIGGYCIMSPTM